MPTVALGVTDATPAPVAALGSVIAGPAPALRIARRCSSETRLGQVCRRPASVGLVRSDGVIARHCLLHFRRGLQMGDSATWASAAVVPEVLLAAIASSPSLSRHSLATGVSSFFAAPGGRHPFSSTSLDGPCSFCGRPLGAHRG